ncbi:IspD/TarI family cytidylyltransferase [Arsenicicoccus dermatophilus]|uniref:IspD/TarI family cytidylyltransferase n=1 Tax=Arsenicicoccus dermatophilus TaxID=1076331 RepID=UPI001F4CBCC5|nr:2-C-methyl-D-erythritol 4-phosphate cytidylyltransferase [Arsenicicoccus dermatophilus]
MSVAVIIVAAGSGSRLGADRPKALVEVAGRSILEHSLRTALQTAGLAQVVVVAPAGHLAEVGELVERVQPSVAVTVVAGGADRTASVAAGLAALTEEPAPGGDVDGGDLSGRPDPDGRDDTDGLRGDGPREDDLDDADVLTGADTPGPAQPRAREGASGQVVLVHDAARCFTPVEVYDRVAGAVRDGWVAVVPALPVVDTVKVVDARGVVTATPDRASLRAVQTPQGFLRAELEAAHATGTSATDDAALLEALGHQVLVVEGDPAALKVTVPDDLERAARFAIPDGPSEGELR